MADTIGEAFVAIRPDLSGFEAEISAGLQQITATLPLQADTTELTAAVDQVTSTPADVAVDGDTTELQAGIAAVTDQAAPAEVPVDGDTTGAEAALTGFVAAADAATAAVTVSADTGPAQDEIDALIGGADQEPIEIPVSAPGAADAAGGLEQVHSAAEGLHGVSEVTAGSAAGLTTILSKMGPEGAAAAAGVTAVAAGTAELFKEGLTAIGAEERFNRLLGDQAEAVKQVNVGSLSGDLLKLGEQFGSTNAEVENSASNLFQFATNAGASGEESTKFADQIAALSARAIALNPNLGSLSDVADSLSTRIARGGRFAASFGISLSAADINARALSDTGKQTAADLTIYEKSAAAAELATTKYGDSLGKTVADGAKNAQVEVSAVGAEFHNAIEEIGKPLVAPILGVLHDAIEPGTEVGKIFGTLGAIAVPLVDDALRGLTPILSGVNTVLEDAAPVLDLVDTIISDIPGPVLTAAAAYGLLLIGFRGLANFSFLTGILEGIGVASVTMGAEVETAAAEVVAAEVAVEAFNPVLLALSAAVAVVTAAWSLFSSDSPDNTQAVDDLTKALADQNGVIDASVAKVQGYLTASSEIGKDPAQVKALNDLGLSFANLADLTNHGADAQQRLIDSAVATGKATQVETDGLSNVIKVNGKLFQVNDDGTRNLIENYKKLTNTALQSSEAQIATGKATGQLTDAQIKAAEDAHHLQDGTVDYVAALQDLKPNLDQAAQAEADKTAQTQDAAKASLDAAAATQKQQDTLAATLEAAPAIRLAYSGIATSVGDTKDSFLGLALGIDGAHLSSDQLDALAVGLGTTSDQLKQFADDVKKAIDGMVSDATSKLPTAQGAIDAIVQFLGKVPDSLNPNTIIGAIQKNLKAVTDYQANIDFLFSQGLPHLTELALKEGPAVTAGLVQGIKDGGPEVGRSLDGSLAFADASASNFATHIRDDIAPQLALQTGLIGQLMTDAFGTQFRIQAPTADELDRARLEAELAHIPLADALRITAGEGAVAYQQAIGALPGITQGTVNGVMTTIDGAKGGVQGSGAGLGDAAHLGFNDPTKGIGQVSSDVLGVGNIIANAADNKEIIQQILGAGNVLGVALDTGIIQGINFGAGPPNANENSPGVSGAMVRMILAAVDAARNAAGVHSPSTVMAEVGGFMADGLVAGLDGGHADVHAAAVRLAGAAFPANPAAVNFSAPSTASPQAGPGPGQPGAGVPAGGPTTIDNRKTFIIHSTDPFVAAAEVMRKDRADSRGLELLS